MADTLSDCQLLGKQSRLVLLKQLIDNLLDRDLLSLPQLPDIGFELPIAVGGVVEGEEVVVTPFLIRGEVAPLQNCLSWRKKTRDPKETATPQLDMQAPLQAPKAHNPRTQEAVRAREAATGLFAPLECTRGVFLKGEQAVPRKGEQGNHPKEDELGGTPPR
uniref:Uncharacterized protein n=1 Tax=Chromera velia CCMP2878 TaxID=1169474 RepID=A0A0G4HU39_9ALVE|eukprot:Cvel_8596.t1-p1 / transcript=Cvel_8596.t1 / gene=Cvel_8596 / organism=Chromera_velia_CCMP2878 / gene_product=hypothetical protein / transcript_product=hypothetical protein / location=Cvel_scaffold477:33492-34126(+) / protein_length=161 / sequence_SO=supercontig / SO=protein_coding / is_pseudo=false